MKSFGSNSSAFGSPSRNGVVESNPKCDLCLITGLTCDVDTEAGHGCSRCRYSLQDCTDGRSFPMRTHDPPMLTIGTDLKTCGYCTLGESKHCDVDVQAGIACSACTFLVPGGMQCVCGLVEMKPRPPLTNEHAWDFIRQVCDTCYIKDRPNCSWLDDGWTRLGKCTACTDAGDACTRGGVPIPVPHGEVFVAKHFTEPLPNDLPDIDLNDILNEDNTTPNADGNVEMEDASFQPDARAPYDTVNPRDTWAPGGRFAHQDGHDVFADSDTARRDWLSVREYPELLDAQAVEEALFLSRPLRTPSPRQAPQASEVSPWRRKNMTTNQIREIVAEETPVFEYSEMDNFGTVMHTAQNHFQDMDSDYMKSPSRVFDDLPRQEEFTDMDLYANSPSRVFDNLPREHESTDVDKPQAATHDAPAPAPSQGQGNWIDNAFTNLAPAAPASHEAQYLADPFVDNNQAVNPQYDQRQPGVDNTLYIYPDPVAASQNQDHNQTLVAPQAESDQPANDQYQPRPIDIAYQAGGLQYPPFAPVQHNQPRHAPYQPGPIDIAYQAGGQQFPPTFPAPNPRLGPLIVHPDPKLGGARCPLCPVSSTRVFPTQGGLSTHLSRMHKDQKVIPYGIRFPPEFAHEPVPQILCPHCQKLFHPRGLGAHVRARHPGMEKPDLKYKYRVRPANRET